MMHSSRNVESQTQGADIKFGTPEDDRLSRRRAAPNSPTKFADKPISQSAFPIPFDVQHPNKPNAVEKAPQKSNTRPVSGYMKAARERLAKEAEERNLRNAQREAMQQSEFERAAKRRKIEEQATPPVPDQAAFTRGLTAGERTKLAMLNTPKDIKDLAKHTHAAQATPTRFRKRTSHATTAFLESIYSHIAVDLIRAMNLDVMASTTMILTDNNSLLIDNKCYVTAQTLTGLTALPSRNLDSFKPEFRPQALRLFTIRVLGLADSDNRIPNNGIAVSNKRKQFAWFDFEQVTNLDFDNTGCTVPTTEETKKIDYFDILTEEIKDSTDRRVTPLFVPLYILLRWNWTSALSTQDLQTIKTAIEDMIQCDRSFLDNVKSAALNTYNKLEPENKSLIKPSTASYSFNPAFAQKPFLYCTQGDGYRSFRELLNDRFSRIMNPRVLSSALESCNRLIEAASVNFNYAALIQIMDASFAEKTRLDHQSALNAQTSIVNAPLEVPTCAISPIGASRVASIPDNAQAKNNSQQLR